MKILCVFGQHNYGDPRRGTCIEYDAFIPALRSLGHEVHFFEARNAKIYPNYATLNCALLDAVEEIQPEILFTVQRDYELWIETISAIRARGVLAITWTTDDSWKFREVSRFIAPVYDAVATTYKYRLEDYLRCGMPNAILSQWATNSSWLRPPRPFKDCKYPVSFVGMKYGQRCRIIEKLQKAGISVYCFGYGWPAGTVTAEQIPEIFNQSAISLNFAASSRLFSNENQVKARTFEAPGAGTLLLTDVAPGLEQYYEIGKEIDAYENIPQLIEKIQMYLKNPQLRDRVARAGYERTVYSHTYENRLRELMEAVKDIKRQVPPDGPDPATLQKCHVLTPTLRLLRAATCMPMCFIWGEHRGMRVARRLTFEFSWRIFGQKTFTAVGLPGRMYPMV